MGLYLTKENYQTQTTLNKAKLYTDANNRRKLLFEKTPQRERNKEAGNWGWNSAYGPKPPTTRPLFAQTVPERAGDVDWNKEENLWLRTPEFRKLHVANYRNAHSTERQIELRNQLTAGYWQETITKGRVLNTQEVADGVHNPDGLNLADYATP